jgi:hypothetical protein
MNKILFLLVLALSACGTAKNTGMSTGDRGREEGFMPLFDGSTTKGWHTYGKSGIGKAWKAEGGTLHLDAAAKKDWQTQEGGDIVSDEEFENFHLKLDWKIAPKGNSGIIFYINEDLARYPYPWHTGPEMQVLDNGSPTVPGHADARLYTHRAGDLYDLIASKEMVKPAGEWNAVEIISNKGFLEFYMNGERTLTTVMWGDTWRAMLGQSKFKDMKDFGSYKKGRIGLQDHGDDVWFRNIRIKKL